ncbi:MAG: ROK family protein [Rhodothermales bacterium]|nr:ROK family protein [Rhodothermales bacterium]
MNTDQPLYGGIEAGGTKFVCTIASGPDDVRAIERFPTTSPAETFARALAFFRAHDVRLQAIGIASFGPVDPDPSSPYVGYITTTPKAGWANTDFGGYIGRELGVPVGFDTDVNGAALGEARWGAARGLDTVLYLTVGTGIGGGAIVNGRCLHGLVHPEMGHLMLPRAEGDTFAGHCPYHGPCLEGMATGPAIEARWGKPAPQLPSDHPAWAIEAHYLAMALVNYILTLSPQRIVMGGGVMDQQHLFPMIRSRVQKALNGYVQHPAILQNMDAYIVPPGLGDRAGVLGAIALAMDALNV